MRWSTLGCALLPALLPLSVLAGKFQQPSLRARNAGHARIQVRNNTATTAMSKFKLTDFYTGQSFIEQVVLHNEPWTIRVDWISLFLAIGTFFRPKTPLMAMSTTRRAKMLNARSWRMFRMMAPQFLQLTTSPMSLLVGGVIRESPFRFPEMVHLTSAY